MYLPPRLSSASLCPRVDLLTMQFRDTGVGRLIPTNYGGRNWVPGSAFSVAKVERETEADVSGSWLGGVLQV